MAYSLVFTASATPAFAQKPFAPQNVATSIESLTPTEAEQARLREQLNAAPPAYEDRFMSAEDVSALSGHESTDTTPQDQPEGLRTWALESRMGIGQSDSSSVGQRRATELGQRIEYRQQTLNYGEWSLQMDARQLHGTKDTWNGIGTLGYANEPYSQRFTLRNLAAPLASGLFADTTLGDQYSELTTGLSRNYRLTLGSTTVRGLSTRVYGSDIDLRAGFGERGDLLGGPYPGFEKSQGSLAWLGGTRRLGGAWYAAGQFESAINVPASYSSLLTSEGFGSKSTSSWAMALGYGSDLRQDGDVRARLTALGSNTNSTTPNTPTGGAQGLYLEMGTRLGRFRHELGAYYTRPNLQFGDYLLPSNTQGAYWRADYSANRLSLGGGLEYESTRASTQSNLQGSTRLGINSNAQFTLTRNTSVGGSLNAYETRYDSDSQATLGALRSLYAYGYFQTRILELPRTRLSLTLRRNEQIVLNDGTATGKEFQWEQDWISAQRETMRPEVTTTLGWADDRSNGNTSHYPTAGIQMRYWANNRLSIFGNLRYTSQTGGLYTSRGLSGSLSAEQDLGKGWRIGVSASLNQARATAVPIINWTGPQIYRSNDKTAYVYLRWEGSTGRPFAIANGTPGTGAGRVSGRVFFDANRDDQPQVGEGGVAGVEVVMDGRYRATTDRDGRFAFPMVGVGHHQLTLTLDSVPLPWGAASNAGVSIDVPLRGEATAEIPVVKVGE